MGKGRAKGGALGALREHVAAHDPDTLQRRYVARLNCRSVERDRRVGETARVRHDCRRLGVEPMGEAPATVIGRRLGPCEAMVRECGAALRRQPIEYVAAAGPSGERAQSVGIWRGQRPDTFYNVDGVARCRGVEYVGPQVRRMDAQGRGVEHAPPVGKARRAKLDDRAESAAHVAPVPVAPVAKGAPAQPLDRRHARGHLVGPVQRRGPEQGAHVVGVEQTETIQGH
nr:hypothetical protein [Pandoravirus belohorizontensis]